MPLRLRDWTFPMISIFLLIITFPLTHLFLGESFDYFISSLPPSLTILKFHENSDFNHPLSCLPSSLRYLELGNDFDSSPNPLPDSLEILLFNSSFNKVINNLPLNLKVFESSHLKKPLPSLPSKLEQLINSIHWRLHTPLYYFLIVIQKKRWIYLPLTQTSVSSNISFFNQLHFPQSQRVIFGVMFNNTSNNLA